jgi:hypothetical protein
MTRLFVLSLCGGLACAGELHTFRLREVFGVSHPRQVVELDYGRTIADTTYMVGPDGMEAPFQALANGNVLIETDLPAKSERVYHLVEGRKPAARGSLQLISTDTSFEVTNGLTGVRIAQPQEAGDLTLAPIQGVRLRDGVWTATAPNRLTIPTGTVITDATARILEQGPLRVTVEVAYAYTRPVYKYGTTMIAPAGAGVYRSTIRLEAGQSAIVIEDDADTDLSYSLDVAAAVQPNQLRYRGHSATVAGFGREADGQVYRSREARNKDSDATRDIPVGAPLSPSYETADYGSRQSIKRLLPWDLWAVNGGWYWLLYNAQARPSAPVVGFFAGRASRALGIVDSGPAVFSNGSAGGIQLDLHRRGPDGRVASHIRVEWGIFLGTKAADLTDPDQVQTIQKPLNLYGGVNLTKVLRYQTTYPDPAGGWSSLYLTREQTQALVQRVRSDPAYARELAQREPTAQPLIDAWRDETGATGKALCDDITAFSSRLLDTYVNGNGIYDFFLQYWMGGVEMSRRTALASGLLAGGRLSAGDKERLKAALALFAYVLWDDDVVPLFDGHMLNLGTSNMPVQQAGYRYQLTLFLPQHPAMTPARLDEARSRTLALVREQVNDWGAQKGSPHYAAAAMEPLINVLQQLKSASVVDAFRDEPRLARFAEFYLNLQTPPEPRFGGLRKLVSLGDGSTEGTELFGQLATALSDINPPLAQRLMRAWVDGGRTGSGFFGSSTLKIDERVSPAAESDLKSATYPGYYSVLRAGVGTGRESAVWIVNGDWYSDHRHDDAGSMRLYALGAPVSIDWGSMYSPYIPGAYHHSLVLPESSLGVRWDQDDVPFTAGTSPWKTAAQEAFESFSYASRSVSRFTAANGAAWTRTVRLLAGDPDIPVVAIEDTFSGPDSAAPKVWTMTLMSNSEVETPQGSVVPPLRVWANGERPSASPVQTLAPGLSRYRFTGQWAIDWDLYARSGSGMEALVGNWAHDWHPDAEAAQFRAANGRAFRERQNILRFRSGGAFRAFLVAFTKGAAAPKVSVDDIGRTVLRQGDAEASFDDRSYLYRDGERTVVAAFTSDPVRANGIEVSGGPTEVVLEAHRATITAHGAGGTRHIALPSGDPYVLNYEGGDPMTVVLDVR